MPKITFWDIIELIISIKKEFNDKLNSELWMQSGNPDALLVKNLEILYMDNDDPKKQDERCSPEVTQKFLRLIFKREKENLVGYDLHLMLWSDNDFPTTEKLSKLKKMPLLIKVKNNNDEKYSYYIYGKSNDGKNQLLELKANEEFDKLDFKDNQKITISPTENHRIREEITLKDGHNPLIVVPHVIEFLTKRFPEVNIDKLRGYYKREQKELTSKSKSIENLVCIDSFLAQEREEFKKFIGNAKNVYVSIDEEKIKLFLDVIKDPKFYKHEIFKDPDILYYALAACQKGEITSLQFAGLSQWIEFRKVYSENNIKIYQLFDESGEFTEESKEYFLKYVLNKKIKSANNPEKDEFENPLLTDDTLEKFKEHLKKLPKTDQIFVRVGPLDKSYIKDMDFAYRGTAQNAVLFGDKEEQVSFLSINAYQCLINTAFPAHPTKLVPYIGHVGKNDVEKATRENERIVSTYYPRPKHLKPIAPKNQFFHTIGTKTTTVIGLHDVYHCMLMSNINKSAFASLGYAIDAIRRYTGIEWTTGLWQLVDITFGSDISDKTKPEAAFLIMMNEAYASNLEDFHPELAAVLLDIYFEPEKWPFNIKDINSISDSMLTLSKSNSHLGCVREYASWFNHNDDPKINLFKMAIIFEGNKLGKSRFEIELILSSDIFAQNKENILNEITFKKIPKLYEEKKKWFARVYWREKLVDKSAYDEILKDVHLSISKQINSYEDLGAKDNHEHTPLYYVFQKIGWTTEFKSFLKKQTVDLNEEIDGKSYLDIAVQNNDSEFIKFLIEKDNFKSVKTLTGIFEGCFSKVNIELYFSGEYQSNYLITQNFLNAISKVPENKRLAILASVKNKLMIQSIFIDFGDLFELLAQLTDQQRNELINDRTWGYKILAFVKTKDDFLKISELLPKDFLKKYWDYFLKNLKNLELFKYLIDQNITGRSMLDDAVRSKNSVLIKYLIEETEIDSNVLGQILYRNFYMPINIKFLISYININKLEFSKSKVLQELAASHIKNIEELKTILKLFPINDQSALRFMSLLSVETLKKCFLENQKKIIDAITECNNLDDLKLKNTALFALLKIYQSELPIQGTGYSPTLYASSSKVPKVLDALMEVMLENKPLDDVYKKHKKAIDQDEDLNIIYNTLKSTKVESIKLDDNRSMNMK